MLLKDYFISHVQIAVFLLTQSSPTLSGLLRSHGAFHAGRALPGYRLALCCVELSLLAAVIAVVMAVTF